MRPRLPPGHTIEHLRLSSAPVGSAPPPNEITSGGYWCHATIVAAIVPALGRSPCKISHPGHGWPRKPRFDSDRQPAYPSSYALSRICQAVCPQTFRDDRAAITPRNRGPFTRKGSNDRSNNRLRFGYRVRVRWDNSGEVTHCLRANLVARGLK